MTDERSMLTTFIDFADKVQALADAREVPAYSETCKCGGSIVVSRDIPGPDRRRMHVQFVGRHMRCTDTRIDTEVRE